MNELVEPAERVEINAAEFRFDVDGEPFPWFITPEGPSLTELPNGLSIVGVEILVLASFTASYGCQPVIGDRHGIARTFPWAIHEDGFVYTQRHTDAATVRLSFLTSHLTSADVPITVLPRDCAIPPDQPATEGEPDG